MNTRSKTDKTAQGKPELPTEHDCQYCGLHFSDCVCDTVSIGSDDEPQPQAQHSPWFGAYDSEGKLRATFDSESEAYHYVRNRGHMDGGSDKLIVTSVNHAEALAEALRELSDQTQLARKYIILDDDNGLAAYHATAKAWNVAREALANWEGAQ